MSSSLRDAFRSGKSIGKIPTSVGGDNPYDLLDADWVRTSFMLNNDDFEADIDKTNRFWSTASSKFTDSRLGGNIGINNAPQYTPYADFPVPGRLAGRAELSITNSSGNYGWGHYYSEAVDDTKQTIFLRFGVPQFNSLINFLSRAFDPGQSTFARTGRMPSAFYTAGKLIGTFVTVVSFPVVAITLLAGRVASFFFNRSTSKFYTMKPLMFAYWSTANLLANTLAVNVGIFPKILNRNADDTQRIGQPFSIDQEYLTQLQSIMPDVFGEQNYWDLHSMANRAQRLANEIHTQEFNMANNGTPTDFTGYLKRELSGDGTHSTKVVSKNGKHRLSDLLDETFKLTNVFRAEDNSSAVSETDPRINTDSKEGKEEDKSWLNRYAEYFDAEFRMGSQFATFNVDYTGPQTTSFSSSAVESQIQQKLNSASSTVRSARFALAEGNFVGETVKDIMGAFGDLASGVLNGVTLDLASFVQGILGDGYVDVPKHWQSSSVSLPRTTYTMTLMTTYNTPIQRMMKLYIPISMLLAGALPRSIGKQSYTSPFLCQVFDKGRNQIRLGMIESLSITAGAGANIGFDHKGNPLAFEISMNIVDLSSVMHMPVSSGEIFGVDMTMDEDNILTDYLAVLASQDIYSQIYPMSAARLRLAKAAINYGKWTSPAFWAAATHNSATTGVLQYLTLGAGNILEAAVRGAEVTAGR